MRREGLSTVSTFLVSVLIFLFIGEIQARKLQQVCSSSRRHINNIRYPFRLKGDPEVCGHPSFELSCENNQTILEFHLGKYYVKGISHQENIMSVVDVNLSSGTCRLPSGSLSDEDIKNEFFKNVTPIHLETEVFSNMTENYETIRKPLQSGFILTWSFECRDCLAPDGTCSVRGGTTTYFPFCRKSTDPFIKYLRENIYVPLVGSIQAARGGFAKYEVYFMDWYVNMGFLLGQLLLDFLVLQ
ncbi:hypothetical protein Pint_22118 [Pistacia integerrima]|uniref:Uncharacterized protein n=1 Tax=Pistacia integerrima TaxID=434235 RepID=A0ACC0YKU0_9ROSI|nr:hypothetical protein Pint_22118 [Pistacia integerrima]